jgi:hypothetical protein
MASTRGTVDADAGASGARTQHAEGTTTGRRLQTHHWSGGLLSVASCAKRDAWLGQSRWRGVAVEAQRLLLRAVCLGEAARMRLSGHVCRDRIVKRGLLPTLGVSCSGGPLAVVARSVE